ncbi:restriction endonuclease [Pseudomonas wayambapalatensis]|nr:restriction endonuclease [Pseudomonas wayambapalatensis]
MSWKKYQEDAAEIFRSIGWSAKVEAPVTGIRGTHKVDVLVSFKHHDIDCMWVVECKHWNSAVPKEKVLALKAIVDDLGADKGILISKKGFQSGAIQQAYKTNIHLTSLDTLKHDVQEEVMALRVRSVEKQIIALDAAYKRLTAPSLNAPFAFLEHGIQGMDGQKAMVFAWLLDTVRKDMETYAPDTPLKVYRCDETTAFDMSRVIESHETDDQIEYLSNIELIMKITRGWLLEKNVPFP